MGSPRAELTRVPNALACRCEPLPEAAAPPVPQWLSGSVLPGAGSPVISRLGQGWLVPLQAKLVREP